MRCTQRFRGLALVILSLAALPGAGAYAQTGTPAYTFTDLGGLLNPRYVQSGTSAINDAGQIVGYSYTPTGYNFSPHPVVWAKDATGSYVITDLGTLGGPGGGATGINDHGEIVGHLDQNGLFARRGFLVRPVTVNGTMVWYQDLNQDGLNDLMTDLGDVAPTGISDNTQISAGPHLVQFDALGGEIVTTLPRGGTAYAINGNQVAGQVDDAKAPMKPAVWRVDPAGNALSVRVLKPLVGTRYGNCNCVNAAGQAAGSCAAVSGNLAFTRAALWQSDGTVIALGPPLGNPLSTSNTSGAAGLSTVNGVLQVVGSVDILNQGERALLWQNGVMTDLNTLISASGVTLSGASAINARGQIVGGARVTVGKNNIELHAYLLTPK
jgi:probable HAF family extracellular repeat protein